MKILITGGSGLIGTALCEKLQSRSHSLIVLTRTPEIAAKKLGADIRFLTDLNQIKPNENIDAVINLAGAPIADKRWTPKRKKILEDSRIQLTANLIQQLAKLNQKPRVLISGSAIGYYGNGEDNILSEQTQANDEFTHRLCAAWEMQALRAKAQGIRVCILRTGIVIAPDGGMIKKLLPLFRLGLGAQLGNGKQWMSWIHISDMTDLILYLLDNEEQSGIFNATSPNPVTNKVFTKELAKALHRPALFTFPERLLKLIFGEMAHILITGQHVIPKRLLQTDFHYDYPDIHKALENIRAKK